MNRPTMIERINARLEARRNGERGLALLDVLLGMAIFALIVVIGIQSFQKFRERAFVTQMSSDVKQAGTAVEASLTEPGATLTSVFGDTLPTANAVVTPAQLTSLGIRLTAGSRLVFISGTNADDYVLCADKGAGTAKSVRYDASVGAVGGVTDTACTA